MRRNRTKTRKKSNKNYFVIITFVVLLFVGAPTIGYFGTKYFLIPKYIDKQKSQPSTTVSANANEKLYEKIENKAKDSNSNKSKESNTTNEETNTTTEQSSQEKLYTLEIPALNIYSVQVGSFDNKKHAETQVKDLNSKGLGGYIVQSDRFRVMTMSFTERSNADKYKEQIKSHYSDAFIAPKQLPIRSIKYNDNGKAYSEAASSNLNELKKYYEDFSSFIAKRDITSTDSNELIQFVDSEIKRLDKISQSIASVSPSEDFTSFNSKFSSIVETAKTKLTKEKQSNLSDRKKVLEIFMESINSYQGII
jgi:cell division septation protein DedD